MEREYPLGPSGESSGAATCRRPVGTTEAGGRWACHPPSDGPAPDGRGARGRDGAGDRAGRDSGLLPGQASIHLGAGALGLAGGVVTVASIVGLLLPATDEGSTAEVVVGFVVGVAFLTIARLTLRGRDVHVGKMSGAGGSVV